MHSPFAMDQDSFRRLLHQAPRPGTSTSRGSLFTPASSKSKGLDASQPAFKPRKINKATDSKYRDRAAERRGGEANDYAQVETVLEDFEKRNANAQDKSAVEEQRLYLGGDSDHSILVKGLDFALLEQNKARAAALNTEDDDSLEQAYLKVSSQSTVPKKRTREDLIRELKEKRAMNGTASFDPASSNSIQGEAQSLEEVNRNRKFKPIGFKPIGGSSKEMMGKKKPKGDVKDGERKKKQRKVVDNGEPKSVVEEKVGREQPLPVQSATSQPPVPAPLDPELNPFPDNFDIFADAGDYEGVGLGDDDDDGEDDPPSDPNRPQAVDQDKPSIFHWVETNEPERLPEGPERDVLSSVLRPPQIEPLQGKDEDEGENEGGYEVKQQLRLQPLESSTLPSIKDFLAMDNAGGSGKRKNRKNKKGARDGGNEPKRRSAEAKADRDFKRLKSYTDQKVGQAK